MTLTIPLSREAECELRERATAGGIDIVRYVTDLVERELTRRTANPQTTSKTLVEMLTPAIEEAKAIRGNASPTPRHGQEAEIDEIIADKYRKQGLTL